MGNITQVGGVAYSANNIYFSSWLTLAACGYTLNEWSAAKDLLSIAELTGLSATLKSWYVLFLSSLVTLGTAANLRRHISVSYQADASYCIAMGTISLLVSFFFILVHYRFIVSKWIQLGGWFELSFAAFMVFIWTIEVAVVTQDGGIAPTISGDGCRDQWGVAEKRDFEKRNKEAECIVIWNDLEPADTIFPDNSNLTVSSNGNEITVSANSNVRHLQDDTLNNTTIFNNTNTTLDINISFFDDDIAALWNNTLNDTNVSIVDDTSAPTFTPFSPPTPAPMQVTAPSRIETPQPSFTPTASPSTAPTFLLSGIGEQRLTCDEILENVIPGSNLYLASWISFCASFNVALRWKAAQALQFAQAQTQKAEEAAAEAEREAAADSGDDEDDNLSDDDDDDYPDDSSVDQNF